MSTYKSSKVLNNSSSNENVNVTTNDLEPENLEISLVVNYQELNNKCDKVITKIKNRKLKK